MRRVLVMLLGGLIIAACARVEHAPATREGDLRTPGTALATTAPLVVPNLRGVPEATALETLDGLGLLPGARSERLNDYVAVGAIVRTFPAVGETVPPGTKVDYVVSLGPQPSPTLPPPSGLTPAPSVAPDGTPEPTRIEVRGFALGLGFQRVDGIVQLTGKGNRFKTTDRIAWRVSLPDLDPATQLRLTVTRGADGAVVARAVFRTEGRNVIYDRLKRLTRSGSYAVRLYGGGRLIATERMSLDYDAGPTATSGS